jgi:hypothetical protein
VAQKKRIAPAERLGLPADYAEFLASLKARIRQAQTKAQPLRPAVMREQRDYSGDTMNVEKGLAEDEG